MGGTRSRSRRHRGKIECVLEISVHSHLAVHRRLPIFGFDTGITAIRLHLPGVDGITKLKIQDSAQLLGNLAVIHPDADFYTAFRIARQKVLCSQKL